MSTTEQKLEIHNQRPKGTEGAMLLFATTIMPYDAAGFLQLGLGIFAILLLGIIFGTKGHVLRWLWYSLKKEEK